MRVWVGVHVCSFANLIFPSINCWIYQRIYIIPTTKRFKWLFSLDRLCIWSGSSLKNKLTVRKCQPLWIKRITNFMCMFVYLGHKAVPRGSVQMHTLKVFSLICMCYVLSVSFLWVHANLLEQRQPTWRNILCRSTMINTLIYLAWT